MNNTITLEEAFLKIEKQKETKRNLIKEEYLKEKLEIDNRNKQIRNMYRQFNNVRLGTYNSGGHKTLTVTNIDTNIWLWPDGDEMLWPDGSEIVYEN